MTQRRDVLSDLVEEGNALDSLLADVDEAEWARPTPAEGWSVRHQIAHLTMVFGLAEKAAADPAGFDELVAGIGNFGEAVENGLKPYLPLDGKRLMDAWRTQRAATDRALRGVPPGQLVPWLVRPIPAGVLAAAGMMEMFAHGQDVADALQVTHRHTDRIRHVAEFAALTWEFGYQSHGLPEPRKGFRFELTAPSGEVWTLGALDAEQRITGPAVDFCLLATRRRHRDDLALTASGPDADQWLDIAQAYRGPAGPGRKPGQFAALGR
ncbi:TIGR03084 family metal-binding protein [Streptomyces ficellus]|uniref:TIGR03084 family metal-binding protein n=1 Tax=Streptomyces ficellus TaxID=1977088 RepID=A0ABT7YZZ4_9ACTN|nr:TIGR03084 family metal-binding protein [Streptomyces ficellus]MDN3292814.1 TIGR03084 family metal-binding protein [Streptomyces ficellus]